MKKVKAKLIVAWEDIKVITFIAGIWRLFGTPYLQNRVKPHSSTRSAKRGAERVAKALGIKLEWVD